MSMNNVIPSTLFGGTWEQIEDKFLLCSSSSKKTGGSTTIKDTQLPAHEHTFSGATNTESNVHDHQILWQESGYGNYFGTGDYIKLVNGKTYTTTSTPHTHRFSGTTDATGDGEEYWQPYMTCYCWFRVA